MSFLHPEFLYYMLPPLFVLFGLLLTQKETQEHFFSQEVMDKLRVSANSLTIKARNALFLLMAIFMIVALSEPVIKDAKVKVKAKSADIMIALDISDSMLATDMYPNRLELAKQKAITLLDSAPNERIGVVAFAKNSYLVSPLSFDTAAVSFLLKQLDTSSITEKGTDILSVLKVVNQTQKDNEKKYLLLLSDGGDKKDFSKEIEMAKENGIVVFVLGIATKAGAPIKLKNGEFIKHNGAIIVSKLNESISELATQTGGVYIQAVSSSNDIKTMFREISSISDEKDLKSEEIQKYIPLFYYPVAMALFLLLIATSSISKRQSNLASIFVLSLALFSTEVKAGLLDFMELDKAKKAYELGEFEKSAEIYKNYADTNAKGEAYFNAGNSFYKQDKYKEAIDSYKKATFDTNEQRAKNLSNMANAYAKQGKGKNLQEAVKSYEESLKLLEDKDTRENMEMVKKLLEKEKNKDKQDNKDQKNQDKKDDKKKDSKDSKDSKKKDSDENKDKSSDEKDKNKDEKNSSKSKKSDDKQKNKDDMKSKKEKSEQEKQKAKEKQKKKKEDLKKLKKDEKKKDEDNSKAGAPQELSKEKMSEAEEQKWLKQLNMNKNTYMYKLNKEQKQYEGGDEKPW